MPEPLTLDLVNHAIAQVHPGCTVQGITVLDRFDTDPAEVLRLEVVPSPANVHPLPSHMFAKRCAGAAVRSEGLPEIACHERILARASPPIAPRLLGAFADGEAGASLLLTEDLDATHLRPAPPVTTEVLERIVDAIATFHAAWWQDDELAAPRFATPHDKPTRMPQAYPLTAVRANMQRVPGIIGRFLETFPGELTAREAALLQRVQAHWPRQFERRVEDARAITLIHGDLHILGNVFLDPVSGSPRFIDWADCKPGIGAHDVAYCLIPADTPDRPARDTALLRRYHQRLDTLGVRGYGWDQCLWDYRFALLTNLLQCALQGSLGWLRRTVAIIDAWRCDALLTTW